MVLEFPEIIMHLKNSVVLCVSSVSFCVICYTERHREGTELHREKSITIQARFDSLVDVQNNPKFKFSNLLTGGVLGRDSAFVRFRLGKRTQNLNLENGFFIRLRSSKIRTVGVYWPENFRKITVEMPAYIDYKHCRSFPNTHQKIYFSSASILLRATKYDTRPQNLLLCDVPFVS